MDSRDIRFIHALYWNQTAAVAHADAISDYVPIKKGVRQGCVMSPDLFNIYSELIFSVMDAIGINVGGKNVVS